MADIRKTIILSAQDQNLSSTVEKATNRITQGFERANESVDKFRKNNEQMSTNFDVLNKETADLFRGLIKDSERYGTSLKERVKYMEREVNLIEKASTKERQRARESTEKTYKEKIKAAEDIPSVMERLTVTQKAKQARDRRFQQLSEEESIDDLQTEKLRERIKEYHDEEVSRKKREINEEEEDEKSEEGVGGRTRNRVGRFATDVGTGITTALGFGAVLSISGFIGKIIDEAVQREVSTGRLSGVGGSGVGGLLDAKTAEMQEYARNIAIGSGSTKNLNSRASSQYLLERAYGLDVGQAGELTKGLRATGKQADAAEATIQMLALFKKSGILGVSGKDFSLLGEKIDFQTQLNSSQADRLNQVSSLTSAQLLADFSAMNGQKGVFSDYRQSGAISIIDRAITNPTNDFKQAYLYRVLRQSNPNASFWDIKRIQNQGIYGKGTFENLMKSMTSQYSGDILKFNLQAMTGLSPDFVDALVSGYKPGMFSNVGSEQDLTKIMSGIRDQIPGRASSNTSVVKTWQARFADWTAGMGDYGISKAESVLNGMKKGDQYLHDLKTQGFGKFLDDLFGKDKTQEEGLVDQANAEYEKRKKDIMNNKTLSSAQKRQKIQEAGIILGGALAESRPDFAGQDPKVISAEHSSAQAIINLVKSREADSKKQVELLSIIAKNTTPSDSNTVQVPQ